MAMFATLAIPDLMRLCLLLLELCLLQTVQPCKVQAISDAMPVFYTSESACDCCILVQLGGEESLTS
jgi:hypothetical protein